MCQNQITFVQKKLIINNQNAFNRKNLASHDQTNFSFCQFISFQITFQNQQIMNPAKESSNAKMPKRLSFFKKRESSEPLQNQNTEINTRKKLETILKKRQNNFLKKNLSQYHGRSYALDYKNHYMFEQKWESSHISKENKEKNRKYLKFGSKAQVIWCILITIFSSLGIWLGTIDLVIDGIQVQWLKQVVYVAALFSQTAELVLKIIKKLALAKNITLKHMVSFVLKNYFTNLLAILLIPLKLSLNDLQKQTLFCIFQATVLILLYFQMSKNYHSIRVLNFSQNYEYHFKVADLISSLLMISHIMALILFSSTKAGFQSTWRTKYGLETDNQLVSYIYSFYFATTTVLTVGYGDITPANPVEILTVTFVQICGIIMLAYVINEIGFCLSSLRKRSEILQKDFEIVDKLKKYYKLNDNVVKRVNEYLINSNEKAYQFTPEQEQGLINKLNEQLRNQVSQLNHLSIVKSSIFLICRWSKAMQNAVALKLQHTLFSPNNTIYQPSGKQRLYFIKSGVIGVYACSDYMNKLLKTISNSLQKGVSDNCYGYTAALSARKIRIQAIAKEFTSAYYIDKDKFLQCAMYQNEDFQYSHQIKNKLLLAKTPESFQLPLFDSNRHHFNPSKLAIIKKLCSSRNNKNKRSLFIRRVNQQKPKSNETVEIQSPQQKVAKRQNSKQFEIIKCQTSKNLEQFSEQTFRFSEKQLTLCSKYKKVIIVPNEMGANELPSNNSTNEDTNSSGTQREKEEGGNKIQNFEYFFESGKEYSNYYSKGNRQTMLYKLQKQSFLPIKKISYATTLKKSGSQRTFTKKKKTHVQIKLQ